MNKAPVIGHLISNICGPLNNKVFEMPQAGLNATVEKCKRVFITRSILPLKCTIRFIKRKEFGRVEYKTIFLLEAE